MFIGEFNHSLDIKGRIALPKKFRSDLEKGLVITKGLDNCLWIYTMEEWENLAKKLINLPISQSDTRAFSRMMLAGAMDVNLDSQGRIVIPEYLRTYANINKKVIIAGLYDRLELWDQDKWDEYKSKTESKVDELAERLGELGI